MSAEPADRIVDPLGPGGARLYRLLRWLRPSRVFQDSATTWPDRYPELFDFARRELGERAGPRLLSFGCSAGDEAFTLRRYFPAAEIVGIDINPACIAQARRRPEARADPRLVFRTGDSLKAAPPGPYDAIFCLSVLRHGALADPARQSCAPLLRFESFERLAGEFAARLRPGGLLVLFNCNFRLRDTAAAARFETALSRPFGVDPDTPLFGPDNRRLADQRHDDIVFRRRPDEGP